MRADDSRGQILVVTAAALVILLGIAALIVDLGFGVLLRRQEQNAVDPGSLAAARFIDDVTGKLDPAQMDDAEAAACYYARQNDFFPAATTDSISGTGCVPANDPYSALLEVVYPPDARAGQFQGHDGFVQVVLTRQRDTFFGRILGFGTMSVMTDAVAARQRGNTNTHSLVSLDPTSCAAARLHGNGTIQIQPAPGYVGDGGYVQVNSECGEDYVVPDDCDNMGGALRIDGSMTELIAPKVNVHGSCRSNGDQITGVLDEGASQIGDPLSGLVFPAWNTSLDGARCGVGGAITRATGPQSEGCRGNGPMMWSASPDANCPGMLDPGQYDCVELQPGVYYGGWNLGAGKWHLKLAPGIYIIAGGGITSGTDTLSSVGASGSLPAPILIYNTDNPLASCPGSASGCQGDIELGSAQSTLYIAGLLGTQPCPPVTTVGGCPYGGLVIWHDGRGSQGYSGQINIIGGPELFISGTIYAPTGHVDVLGNAATNCALNPVQVLAVQIISWTWNIGGTGDLCMPYDPNLLYHPSMQGLVH